MQRGEFMTGRTLKIVFVEVLIACCLSVSYAGTNKDVEKEAKEKNLRPYYDYHPEMDSLPVGVKQRKKEKMEITPFRIPLGTSDAKLTDVAVMNFSPENVSSMEAAISSDFVRSEISEKGKCNIISKDDMNKMLSGRKIKKNCMKADCAARIGQILGVKQIVVGNLTKIGKAYFVNAKLVDVEEREILASESARASTAGEIRAACSEVAKKLVK
jgi:TolB-like protein